MELRKWYKLDNAGKIFPSVSTKSRSNVFRLSAQMTEKVDPLMLQKATELSIKRFPTLNVRLRRGLFWYYLEANDNYPRIEEESPFMLRAFEHYREKYGFLFRITYYDQRISVEMFHSLTDGTGALEFLKSIIYTYLQLKDAKLPESTLILTEQVEQIKEEEQDSFNENFNSRLHSPRREVKALKYKSPIYRDNWLGLITGYVALDELKALCKRHNVTITEYISAVVIMAAYRSKQIFEDKNRPFNLMVPVNLRRFFPSKSLRNFSLFVNTSIDLNKPMTFEEILARVKNDMAEELQKDKLQAHLTNNVRAEKNVLLRLAPRFLKEVVLKIAYLMLGDRVHSISFSNLGVVQMPTEMKKMIEYFDFTPGGGRTSPLNMGVITYDNTVSITFSTALTNRSIEKEFFTQLVAAGLRVVIDHNDLEV